MSKQWRRESTYTHLVNDANFMIWPQKHWKWTRLLFRTMKNPTKSTTFDRTKFFRVKCKCDEDPKCERIFTFNHFGRLWHYTGKPNQQINANEKDTEQEVCNSHGKSQKSKQSEMGNNCVCVFVFVQFIEWATDQDRERERDREEWVRLIRDLGRFGLAHFLIQIINYTPFTLIFKQDKWMTIMDIFCSFRLSFSLLFMCIHKCMLSSFWIRHSTIQLLRVLGHISLLRILYIYTFFSVCLSSLLLLLLVVLQLLGAVD